MKLKSTSGIETRYDYNSDKDGIGRFYMKMKLLTILSKLGLM
jgi:hypothetical protein